MKKHLTPVGQPDLTFFRVMPSEEELPKGATLMEIIRSWQHQKTPLIIGIEESIAKIGAPPILENSKDQSPHDFDLPF